MIFVSWAHRSRMKRSGWGHWISRDKSLELVSCLTAVLPCGRTVPVLERGQRGRWFVSVTVDVQRPALTPVPCNGTAN